MSSRQPTTSLISVQKAAKTADLSSPPALLSKSPRSRRPTQGSTCVPCLPMDDHMRTRRAGRAVIILGLAGALWVPALAATSSSQVTFEQAVGDLSSADAAVRL